MRMKCNFLFVGIMSLFACMATSAFAAVPVHQVQIVAEDMCCQGCARKVSGQLYAARGVKEVGVDMKTRTVTISLPESKAASLGQLWHAVERGDGGPKQLVTSEATYTLSRPDQETNPQQTVGVASPLTVAIDNLHCQGCAKKIAAQLYAIKGVTRVSVDMQKETLIVETQRGVQISPWAVIDAVSRAKERPLAVLGSHGQLTIKWATKTKPKNHQQAQQPNLGGIQR